MLDAITGWLLFASLMAATGAVALRWVVLPRAGTTAALPVDRLFTLAGRYGTWAVALLLPALALVFLRQLLEFRDPFVPWTEDARLLLAGTAWGRTYLMTFPGLVVAWVGFRGARTGRTWGWVLAAVSVLLLGAFPALTGHASAGEGPWRAATLVADVLHVWAAGGWIGGLAGILVVARLADGRDRGGGGLLSALVPAFSPWAVVCVTVLVITGVFASVVHLPTPAAVVSSPYGRTLAVKLVLVAFVLGFGWLNWRKLTPQMATPGGEARLSRSAVRELLLVQGVLLVTAILVRTPPPPG